MTPNTTRALAWQFAHIAGQYYVAARFSALAGSVPVSANLMHYTFEFLLKAFVLSGCLPAKVLRAPMAS